MAKVGIIMGSTSDLETMKEAVNLLKDFRIPFEVKVLSAHRTPHHVARFAQDAKKKGVKVIIAGAGCAAALAGVVAAHTTLPVIGVPMESKSLKGMDSLLSTVQMPGGVPVACMAIGKAGAKNSALLAIAILALSDKKISDRLDKYKKNMADKVLSQKIKI